MRERKPTIMGITDKSTRPRRAVASSETAREINRDILLHAVHLHQPVSRADLARLTGLQPSTVSVIIGQLIDEGWVLPGTLGRLPRGRRPTFVTLNDRHVTLAIDLRPGRANLAVVDINGKILGREAVPYEIKAGSTADEARTAIAHIAQAAHTLQAALRGPRIPGAGCERFRPRGSEDASPGVFAERALGPDRSACRAAEGSGNPDRDGERRQRLPVLGALVRELLRRLQHAGGFSVRRHRHGNAGGRERGAGPATTWQASSATWRWRRSGPVCGCGNVGCWEVFASNRAGLRYYHELAPETTLANFQELLNLALAGDLRALRSIDKMMTYLARGLSMLAAGLAPEVIIIVGDCTALWPRIRPLLESQLIARSITPHTPRVVAAMDGDAARLRGAAALVLHKVLFGQADFAPQPMRGGVRPKAEPEPVPV